MPEIIEAEITKQKLALALKGKRILDFKTDWPKGLLSETGSAAKTKKELKGLKITSLDRIGKAVVINLEGGKILGIHQRISGHIRYYPGKNKTDFSKHAHFIFYLNDKSRFALVDPRKFGTVWFGSEAWFDKQTYIENLGQDVLKIEEIDFADILGNSSASIKSFLLQQKKLAGLGNIACDEILWKAKIDPRRKVSDLSEKEISVIYSAMYSVLADVLRYGGTSMSDWYHPDGEKGRYQENFKVYSKEVCPRCKKKIKRIKVAGRGTYYCGHCQK